MRRIEEVLNLPAKFFLRPLPPKSGSIVWYRSFSAATLQERDRAETRYEWLKEIVAYMRKYVQFPKERFPRFNSLPSSPDEISKEDIEAVAQKTRRYWGLGDGPVSDMTFLVETYGALVAHSDLGTETLESFSQWDDIPFIFLGLARGSAVRSRLNVAHELAHLILHRNITEEFYKDKRAHKLMEEQAWGFAGAFMLPASSFGREVYAPTLDEFVRLKRKWKVSIGAMIKRADNLGFFWDENEVRRTWRNYKRRWSRKEPYDDEIPVEEPSLLATGLKIMIEKMGVTKSRFLVEGFCAPYDIEKLMGLPVGYLDNTEVVTSPATVLEIPFSKREQSDQRKNEGEGANIVKFPPPNKRR